MKSKDQGVFALTTDYQTIDVRFQETLCYLRFNRPEADNTINDLMIEECLHLLNTQGAAINILVLEGSAEVFCFGADFKSISSELKSEAAGGRANQVKQGAPDLLYELWLQLATGPFITVAHVRGKANAGGVGFVAACDIVLADETAVFSLSEMLFGLFPACVLPFLIRRIGMQKAHYMTLMTKPISVEEAHRWGLVDLYEVNSLDLLRKHLLRLRRLPKSGILRYKQYMGTLDQFLQSSKAPAVAANLEIFSDKDNLERITRYVETGQFPWDAKR